MSLGAPQLGVWGSELKLLLLGSEAATSGRSSKAPSPERFAMPRRKRQLEVNHVQKTRVEAGR